MKTIETLQFKMPRRKTRAHFVLFAENTPFRPKREENKRVYARRDKHVKSYTKDL